MKSNLAEKWLNTFEQSFKEGNYQPMVDLAELSFDSVIFTTLENKIVFANKSFELLTGYKPDEVLGKTPAILQGKLTSTDVLQHLDQCMKEGKVFEGETVNYDKDNKPFLMKWRVKEIFNKEKNEKFYIAVQRRF